MPVQLSAKLAPHALDIQTIDQQPTRSGFGEGLVIAGDNDERVVALCADLTESTRMELFARKYPKRFIEAGIAEQNLASVASGLARAGKIPFIASYAMFSPGRSWEQVRTTICYNDMPVKIVGSHAGVSVGPDGATHQAIEDIAITRVLPRMQVLVPCDMIEARKATIAASKTSSPTYIRLTREKTPVFTTEGSPFEIGKAEIFYESPGGADVALIGCGPLLHNALLAAVKLEKKGHRAIVVNVHTIKPLDIRTIVDVARRAGAVVSVEEHQIAGGLGSAVAEVLAANHPVPMEFIGVKDRFGESGEPKELIEHFGMGVSHIVVAAERAVSRK